MIELLQQFAAPCTGGGFLGFPTWYRYLDGNVVNGVCSPVINNINDIWLIVAAIVEILVRIAALAAVGTLIYAGFMYMTSQGEPEKTAKAKTTVINGLIGLVVAILATAIITFVAGSFNK